LADPPIGTTEIASTLPQTRQLSLAAAIAKTVRKEETVLDQLGSVNRERGGPSFEG
jgi:hypothetical protein